MPKLFVRNFPFDTTDEDLQDLFAARGFPNTAQIIKDRETGKPKGYGFVQLDDEGQNQEAIDILNGHELNIGGRKRPIEVKEARPKESRQ